MTTLRSGRTAQGAQPKKGNRARSVRNAEAKRERERQLKAARQGRWRKRRKRGRFVVPVKVGGNLLDRLVARRLLTDAKVYEADLLAQRLAALLDDLSRSP